MSYLFITIDDLEAGETLSGPMSVIGEKFDVTVVHTRGGGVIRMTVQTSAPDAEAAEVVAQLAAGGYRRVTVHKRLPGT